MNRVLTIYSHDGEYNRQRDQRSAYRCKSTQEKPVSLATEDLFRTTSTTLFGIARYIVVADSCRASPASCNRPKRIRRGLLILLGVIHHFTVEGSHLKTSRSAVEIVQEEATSFVAASHESDSENDYVEKLEQTMISKGISIPVYTGSDPEEGKEQMRVMRRVHK